MSQLLKRKCAGLFLGINPKGLNLVRCKGFMNQRRLDYKKITSGLSQGQDEKSLGSITFCKFYAYTLA